MMGFFIMENIILLWLSKKYGNLQLVHHPDHPNNILYFKENKIIININTLNKHVGISMDITGFIPTFFELDYFETDRILKKWIKDNYYTDVKLVMSILYRNYWENEYNYFL
jgi:hypothetical protein